MGVLGKWECMLVHTWRMSKLSQPHGGGKENGRQGQGKIIRRALDGQSFPSHPQSAWPCRFVHSIPVAVTAIIYSSTQ